MALAGRATVLRISREFAHSIDACGIQPVSSGKWMAHLSFQFRLDLNCIAGGTSFFVSGVPARVCELRVSVHGFATVRPDAQQDSLVLV